MTVEELEQKYASRIVRCGSMKLLQAEDALEILDACEQLGLPFFGVEAFRMFEGGGVQPAMEFSNGFQWSEYWTIDKTRDLIRESAAEGYDWFEIWAYRDSNETTRLFGLL